MQKDWRNLIKPKAIEFDEKEVTPTYGRFLAEPFERGYGITIGNALRRILLSSLPGYAVVAVRIQGVLHEFSTIPGRQRGRDRHHPQPQGGALAPS